MFDLFAHLWMWLLGALGVGVAVGYLVKREPRERGVAAWLIWAGLAALAALVAALMGVFAGRAGVWVETAVAAFAAFIGGSALGATLRGGSLREHEGWALGLVPAGLLWLGANLFGAPDFEATLKQKVVSAMERLGGDAASVSVLGRDVTITRSAKDAPGLGVAVTNLDGVRHVSTLDAAPATIADASGGSEKKDAAAPVAAEKKAEATTQGGWGDNFNHTAQSGAGAADAGKGADKGAAPTGKPTAKPAATDAGKTAPAIVEHKIVPADKLKSVLAALPASGALDAASCQSALTATVTLEKIQFRTASATVRLASSVVLDKLAAFLGRCPEVKVEVGGHTDNVGDDESNDDLSKRRAEAVVRYLEREGVARGRLTGVGYGSKKPIASNDDEDGRAENRRIEFVVK